MKLKPTSKLIYSFHRYGAVFSFYFSSLKYVVKEDTLLDMVVYMTSKVGLVHQMPFTCDREGFAATFEKVINQLGAVLATHILMNMMMVKKHLSYFPML